MGRLRRSRTHHMRRDQYRAHRTRARTKDLDQIQLDMDPKHRSKLEVQPIDETLPGLGQHYCVECAKYYETNAALLTHGKSKVHKRRLRELKEPAYTGVEYEKSDNRQRGVEEVVKKMEGMQGVQDEVEPQAQAQASA